MRLMPDLPYMLQDELITALRGDAALGAYLTSKGGSDRSIRQGRTFLDLVVPLVTVQNTADDETELEGPCLMQFDFYAGSVNEARELRRLTLEVVHNDYTRMIGLLEVWSRYLGGRRNDDPTAGTAHLSADVEFFPYREYAIVT